MRRVSLFTFLLLLCVATKASDEVAAAVEAYITDFNKGLSAEYVVKKHWNPQALIVTPTEVLNFSYYQDAEEWLAGIQTEIKKAGWLRSEFIETSTCRLSDTVALYSFRFRRIFEGGAESVSGGTYTLFKSDRWRITTLIFVEPPELVNCER